MERNGDGMTEEKSDFKAEGEEDIKKERGERENGK